MGFIKEFKEFAMKGNLIDMTVAFVMGAAFGKIVTAFINGIVMPVVGMITAGIDFKELKYILSAAQYDAAGKLVVEETAIMYGEFITVFIDFILVAFVMFLAVKMVNRAKKLQNKTPEPVAVAEPTQDQKLLTEIRDLLKNNTK